MGCSRKPPLAVIHSSRHLISEAVRIQLTCPPFQDGDVVQSFQEPGHRRRNNTNLKIRRKGWYPAILVNNELTMDVKFTLSPL
jgi:hypothetical protein